MTAKSEKALPEEKSSSISGMILIQIPMYGYPPNPQPTIIMPLLVERWPSAVRLTTVMYSCLPLIIGVINISSVSSI